MAKKQTVETIDEKQLKTNKSSNIISIIAIIFSIAAIIISIIPYISVTSLHKPSAFAILRGFPPFPSDNILVPLEWEVQGQKDVLLNDPKLILENMKTHEIKEFQIKGEVSQMSRLCLLDTFRFETSFTLKGNCINKKYLIFNIKNYWDDSGNCEDYDFHFESEQKYKVTLEYQIDQKETENMELFVMPIYKTIDNMKIMDGDDDIYWWDYFQIDVGTSKE